MRQKRATGTKSAQETVRDIRRATRWSYSAEEKIRIALKGLRGEESVVSKMRIQHDAALPQERHQPERHLV